MWVSGVGQARRAHLARAEGRIEQPQRHLDGARRGRRCRHHGGHVEQAAALSEVGRDSIGEQGAACAVAVTWRRSPWGCEPAWRVGRAAGRGPDKERLAGVENGASRGRRHPQSRCRCRGVARHSSSVGVLARLARLGRARGLGVRVSMGGGKKAGCRCRQATAAHQAGRGRQVGTGSPCWSPSASGRWVRAWGRLPGGKIGSSGPWWRLVTPETRHRQLHLGDTDGAVIDRGQLVVALIQPVDAVGVEPGEELLLEEQGAVGQRVEARDAQRQPVAPERAHGGHGDAPGGGIGARAVGVRRGRSGRGWRPSRRAGGPRGTSPPRSSAPRSAAAAGRPPRAGGSARPRPGSRAATAPAAPARRLSTSEADTSAPNALGASGMLTAVCAPGLWRWRARRRRPTSAGTLGGRACMELVPAEYERGVGHERADQVALGPDPPEGLGAAAHAGGQAAGVAGHPGDLALHALGLGLHGLGLVGAALTDAVQHQRGLHGALGVYGLGGHDLPTGLAGSSPTGRSPGSGGSEGGLPIWRQLAGFSGSGQ